MTKIHVFADLSRCNTDANAVVALIRDLADPDGLGAITDAGTCVLPASASSLVACDFPGWRLACGEDAIVACNLALEQAAVAERSLLVLLDPIAAGSEAISALIEALHRDAMFGFALPRQSDSRGGIRKLSAEDADPEVETIPRRALSELSDSYIVPELAAACFLVRKELAANLGPLDEGFRTLAGAWLYYMCRARRIGFRCVVVNTSVVDGLVSGDTSTGSVCKEDFWKLHRLYPDIALAREQFSRVPAHALESFLARMFSGEAKLRKTLLIDARGMNAGFNGTVYCALGLLDGLAQLDSGWRVTIMAYPQASGFHRLAERYPHWEILDNVQRRRFTVAVRVSQPWAIETMAELHDMALFNFYSMLDTIAWDVVYNGIKRLDETWGFLSDHADGIMYISDFTGQRFRTRFPLAPGVREFTHHLSFHPDDYVVPLTGAARGKEPYILLIGNELDHKHIPATLDLLTCAFPFESFKALGFSKAAGPQVTTLSSGFIPEEQIERLYANSRLIVFPSFYEGFGFPVLKGLSYGATVIARRTDLLLEVAARHRSRGKLVAFETPSELVEIIGRLLHGLPVREVPLGTALGPGEEPMNWTDIARNLLEFIESATERVDSQRWMARDRAVRQFVTLQA